MSEILERERVKYAAAYKRDGYRQACHGLAMWENHRGIFPEKVRSAVDLGCGTGRLFTEWNRQGIDGWGVDFVDALDEGNAYAHKLIVANLWDLGMDFENRFAPFDLGVCADVMEHIPPELVDQTLANICPLSRVTVFKIANYPSSYTDLGPLHLTLRPADWWIHALKFHGNPILIPALRPGIEEYTIRLDRA